MKEIENLKLKNKPFIIDFWAPWCGPCKTMRPIVESLKNDSFNLLCSNVEESQDLADYFGIRNVPTILFFDKDGVLVDKIVGATNKDNLIHKLEQLCSDK